MAVCMIVHLQRERYSSVKGRVAYVCVHESTGNRRNAHSGHYLCYAEDEGQWHEFNDAKVRLISYITFNKLVEASP